MELQAGVGKIGFVFRGSLWRDRTAILMTDRFTTAMLADEIRVMGHCELWGEPVGQPGSLHFACRSCWDLCQNQNACRHFESR